MVDFNKNSSKSSFFRFEDHWIQMPKVKEMIAREWPKGTRHFAFAFTRFNHKLGRLSAVIRKLNRSSNPIALIHDNYKHALQYLDLVEERRSLSALEFSLKKHFAAKAQ